MKTFFNFAFLLLTVTVFSQNVYTSGYYIDQNNKRNEGFIEDTNPYNNPEKINFKTSLEDKATEVLIGDIREFKINSNYKYVRYTVDYDFDQVVNKSEINIYGKEPRLKKKPVLLKVLVEGNATLYKAIIEDCVFFYFKTNSDETPKLLIHRKYNDKNTIVENNDFRKQLYDGLKTESLPIGEFLNLNFKESELVAVFKKANNQSNSLVEQNVAEDRIKNKFYYKVFAGVSAFRAPHTYNSLELKPKDVAFNNPMVGVEFSNNFGTDSKRSELFGRLFYQSADITSAYHESNNSGYVIDYMLKSKINSINLTAGYRYAFIKSGKNKVCVDGSLGVTSPFGTDTTLDYSIDYGPSNPGQSLNEHAELDKLSTNIFFNIGLGYVFDNRYAVNLEYSTPKKYLSKYAFSDGGYSNLNLIFTYTLNK